MTDRDAAMVESALLYMERHLDAGTWLCAEDLLKAAESLAHSRLALALLGPSAAALALRTRDVELRCRAEARLRGAAIPGQGRATA